MDIPDEITLQALRGFDKRFGYSKLERMRDALEIAAPLLTAPQPVVDREALAARLLARFYVTEGEAIGRGSEVPEWSDLTPADRADWRDHADAVLALLTGSAK